MGHGIKTLPFQGAVYTSPTWRAGPTRRDPACYLKSLLKIVYVYMRRGPPRRDLAIVYPTSRLVGLEISHINLTEGVGPPGRTE